MTNNAVAGSGVGPGYVDSYYAASAPYTPARESLTGDIEVDVCIVGGGFTGVSSALHLAERGYKVALLEAERVGWGAAGRNGGHIGIGQRTGQIELEKRHGPELARTLWDYSLEAVATVRSLIDKHTIDCGLKEGVIHLAARKGDVDYLQSETEHLQSKYDFSPIRFVEKDETRAMIGSDSFHGAQLDLASAHFNPLKYILGLAAAAERAGAKIFEHSRVTGYTKTGNPTVETASGTVRCRHLILACNGYLEKLEPAIASYIMPINNFMLATEPLPESVARELIRDDVAAQDTLFVINYWNLSSDNRLLFGGGETYSRRFPADIASFVRKYMLRIYPQMESARIDYAWGGTLAITLPRMPCFGRLSPNVFYAHGYSGHGIAMGTFAGKLLAEVVSGTAERFDVMGSLPARKFPGGTLLRWPGLVLGMMYYSLRDKF